jgi:mannose-6-phosphate isomerase-like protein (cupin superfamily)
MDAVNLAQKLALIDDRWRPRIVAAVNDFHVKLVKVKGEFVWHTHEDEDELFLVLSGSFVVEMRDRSVALSEGELFVVPRGVEHRPVAEEEASILVLERAETAHTGGQRTAMTVQEQEWI